MHLSEKMDWDFFCYCLLFSFFPLLNLCQFNTKHFQLGFKRSVEIYWLPKWIVNGIACWERAVLLLPLAILHYIKMGLLLNGILRCQCFLQALIFIYFFFLCLAFCLHTDALCMIAYWLHCFMKQWICRQEQAQPIPWAQPGAMRTVRRKAQALKLWFLQELVALAWVL